MNYNVQSSFETFPFPFPVSGGRYLTEDYRAKTTAIANAAKELNELREQWLNPPDWTRHEFIEFPARIAGPWKMFIDPKTVHGTLGTARFPHLVPVDAAAAGPLKKRTLTALYNERPQWLELAHRKLDAAVAAAYGWPTEMTDDEILERLLALNLSQVAVQAEAKQASLASKKLKPQRTKSADELI